MAIDPIQITRLYVFGTETPSVDDYNAHIRPTSDMPALLPSQNMLDYMTTGAGRYAYPSLFGAIQTIFSAILPDSTPATTGNKGYYSYTELLDKLGTTGFAGTDTQISISQYGTHPGTADYYDRAYIYGTTDFSLKLEQAKFTVINGVMTISGMEVTANNDNFDFYSENPLASVINNVFLEPTLDPYNLARGPVRPDGNGKAVTIDYQGSGKTYANYDNSSYEIDQGLDTFVSIKYTVAGALLDISGISTFSLPAGQAYFQNLLNDPFLSYVHNGKKVIYGTPDSDDLDPTDQEFSTDQFNGYFIVGGEGNDTLRGGYTNDELLGGTGNDW
jgi:hypothetical protein